VIKSSSFLDFQLLWILTLQHLFGHNTAALAA